MQLSPYLFFTVQCGPALASYTECGLGQVTERLRHGSDGLPAGSGAMRGKVVHARFEGPGVEFFAPDNDDAEPMRGLAMILTPDDCGRTAQLFEAPGQGGQVTTPPAIQPWGDFQGKLTDCFGVQWMLNCRVAG